MRLIKNLALFLSLPVMVSTGIGCSLDSLPPQPSEYLPKYLRDAQKQILNLQTETAKINNETADLLLRSAEDMEKVGALKEAEQSRTAARELRVITKNMTYNVCLRRAEAALKGPALVDESASNQGHW